MAEAGRLPRGGTSRMNREVHVRICGRLGVQTPGSTRRCPVYRRRESHLGFRTELENLVGDGKGKGTSGQPMRPKVPRHQSGSHCSIVARKRSNARGAKGAGHPRRDGVNGKPEELRVLAEAGRLPRGGTSRMNREIHVRICGGLGVKIPGSTRRC